MMEKICANCKHWVRHSKGDSYLGKDRGKCYSPKFIDVSMMSKGKDSANDTLEYYDSEMYAAEFTTGEKFGCVHFEAGE